MSISLSCPRCGSSGELTDTVPMGDGQARRRRACSNRKCRNVYEVLAREELVAQGVKPHIRAAYRDREAPKA